MKCQCLAIAAAACLIGQASAQSLANYQSTVMAQNPSNYFKLDGGLASAVNPSVSLTTQGSTGGFTYDLFGNPTNSYFYLDTASELSNETDPLINTSGSTNGPINAKGSISFLFRSLSGLNSGGQRWLLDGRKLQVPTPTAGIGFHNALALWFDRVDGESVTDPGCLLLQFGDTTQAILRTNEIAFNTWYYFALTWDEARVPNKAIWYLGIPGQALKTGTTTNAADAVAGQDGGLFIGNRATTGGAFRSPGNGRIDEFAIWGRELSSTEISNQFAQLPASLNAGVRVTNVIVNDSFADGNRANTGPLQADWWSSSSSSGNSVEAYVNKLRLVSGTSGRGLHGTFTPQSLKIGDTIRVTYTFTTPATVGNNRSTAFKLALMEFNDPGLAADLTASSTVPQPLYTNLPGYMGDMDVNTGASADISLRKHAENTTGFFLGTTGEWTPFDSSADAGYTFEPNTEYSGVFSITRDDFDSMNIFCSISQGDTLMDSHLSGDSGNAVTNFGMLGFWVNSSTFGSTTTSGEFVDNGITFSNIKVELITAVPEISPSLSIVPAGENVVLSWPVDGSSGYRLVSAASLTAPVWSSNGPPPVVVGANNVVTNSVTGGQKYYRLIKP